MKKLNKILLLSSALTFIVFQTHTLYASKRTLEGIEDVKQSKFVKLEFSESLQENLKKVKNNHFFSQFDLLRVNLKEIKQLESAIMPEDNMFDSLISLCLLFQPNKVNLDHLFEIAKVKAEGEASTPMAQYNLGIMYRSGQGVVKDFSKSFEWHHKAAEQGVANAQNTLGYFYQIGQGVDINLQEAFKWYNKAAEQGLADAQNTLGYFYQNGQVGDINLQEAFKWYHKAAEQGVANAQNALGYFYQNGQGVDINLQEAFKWYFKAAKRGFVHAQDNLRYLYQNKWGININPQEALKWYLKSFRDLKLDSDLEGSLKTSIKSMVTFIAPTITSEESENFIEKYKKFKSEIEEFLGKHLLEVKINDPDSLFQEREIAIPSLLKPYQEIVNFEQVLLSAIKSFKRTSFMVTCLIPKNINAFKLNPSSKVKYYNFQNQSFLTFGQGNIELADELMDILLNTNKLQSFNSNVSEILEIQKQRKREYQIKAMNIQSQFRQKLVPEDQRLEMIKTLSDQNILIKNIEQEIEPLNKLLTFPQQLKTLLIEGAPFRNKNFLDHKDYIEHIFKD